MKVAVLCGGRSLRLNGGEGVKALAKVHGIPLVRHVLRMYEPIASEYHLLLGHRGDDIRLHFLLHPNSRVHLWETGEDTQTGGRLKRWAQEWQAAFGRTDTIAVSYSDGLSDLDMGALLAFHRSHGKLATVTAVPAVSKFGVLHLDGDSVTAFREKPQTSDWISAGFFLFEPAFTEMLDDGPLEEGPMQRLIAAGQLAVFRHRGFFAAVDSAKDLESVNSYKEPLPWVRK